MKKTKFAIIYGLAVFLFGGIAITYLAYKSHVDNYTGKIRDENKDKIFEIK